MMPKPPMVPAGVPPYWGVYFAVPDTDAAVKAPSNLVARWSLRRWTSSPGRFAVLSDPAGAVFNVITMKA